MYKNIGPIFLMLKTCRHLHINFAIYVQTVCERIKELKRWIAEVFLYRILSFNVLELNVNTVLTSYEIDMISPLYRSLNGKRMEY
jgi:hypothetical protein